MTADPSAKWIARHLTETCELPRYIIHDRDGAYEEASFGASDHGHTRPPDLQKDVCSLLHSLPSLHREPIVNADTEAAIRQICEQWHETVVRRDIRALMELYAEDAILESPLICALQPELGSGILHGKTAIGDFFAAGSRTPSNGLGRWYRTGHFFANGRQLTWEYPRATPDGDQIDSVEVMDVSGGLITHHRVYWG